MTIALFVLLPVKYAKIYDMQLDTQIGALSRVGKTTSARLKLLDINTVADLIFYFPFRYEDYSSVKNIADLQANEAVSIHGKIQLIANRRSFRKRKNITEALIADDSGTLKVVWFNQPFLIKALKVGDEIYLSGKVDNTGTQMVSPDYEKITSVRHSGETIHTARLVPVYHTTSGVTQKQIRFLLSLAVPLFDSIEEYLPVEILEKYDFPKIGIALKNIHFPENSDLAKRSRERFQFEELFLVQLAILLSKKDLESNTALPVAFIEKLTKDFVNELPFKLTDDQKKCSWEIIQDLEKPKLMNRLLEGDVGSGKTIVVALALLNVLANGYKAILMAPTEILAEQHYVTMKKLFAKHKFRIALLTGSKREVDGEKFSKVEILKKINSGEADLIVGTHAVIQDSVQVKDLALVVVDEQHRFGVAQRKSLMLRDNQGLTPHFLSMTATPIPRSLVLALYGDLDLSIIKHLPPNRKPIATKLVGEAQRQDAYNFIEQQVKSGRQVFVICPLIDPSDKFGYKSVKQEFEKLDQRIFPDIKIGLMHGRLKSKEKEEVMQKFLNKEFSILVSTSVIEVGIDVPNATIMMIEGADRFGLAQLHQFRGRVGRGEYQSYCFLFSDNWSELTQKRLKYLEACSDGFKLAEKDLELRGPGEVYGVRQSGLPDLKIASLTDVELLKKVQLEAKTLIEKNDLNLALIKKIEALKFSMHFE